MRRAVDDVIPLRAGKPRAQYLERRRLLARADACKVGTAQMKSLADFLQVSDADIGEHFGGEKVGVGIREGAIAVAIEEAILLFPLPLAAAHTVDLWQARLDREVANDNGGPLTLRLELARHHLAALRTLLVQPKPHGA